MTRSPTPSRERRWPAGAPLLLVPGDRTPAATDEHLPGAAYLGGTIVVEDGSAISDESFARTC